MHAKPNVIIEREHATDPQPELTRTMNCQVTPDKKRGREKVSLLYTY